MRIRHIHAAMCNGKKAYRTWREADQVMRWAIRHSREGRGEMNVYRCRYCHDYHFGHGGKKLGQPRP